MVGGNWTTQNKVLPGVYTNYEGKGNNPAVTGERGIVGLPVIFPWLLEKTVISVDAAAAEKLIASFGLDALLIREAIKNASEILLYRINSGTKATVTQGNLICTAKYSGLYGNKLSVSIENTVGAAGKFDVITWLDTSEIDRQTVTAISELEDNEWINFTKAAEEEILAVSAGKPLASGANGAVTNFDWVAFLSAIELYTVDAIACPSADSDIKSLFLLFAKRMIREEGKYLQVVVPDTAIVDFEGVLSVKNGVMLEDGTLISNVQATAYVAGATAACPLTQSLTNATYIGAVDVDTRYTVAQQTEFAKSGQLVFIPAPVGGNSVVIQKDINTLISFTDKRTYALSKNKIIRTLFAISREINDRGMRYYSGKRANDANGRTLFQTDILSYFRTLESTGVIRDVAPADIIVSPGNLIDAIVVTYAIHSVDVIETIYNTITVEG